jgi:hypothetical protein
MKTNNELYNLLLNYVTIENTIKFFVLYFFVIWIAILVWVYKDITNRTDNIIYQIISILVILIFTPLFGLFIYLIIRPSKTLFEKYYEEVEYNLESLTKDIEQRLKDCELKDNKKKEVINKKDN